jgi:hypothetical protein
MSLTIKATVMTGAGLVFMLGRAIAEPSTGFTFQYAEFLSNEHEGLSAAKAFVAADLPPGLPMREAVMRVEQARASCKAPASSAEVVKCEYFIQARPAEGDLGENVWTVRLDPGPNDTLASASVERFRVGMPGEE